jgi:hypothetical protein
MTPSEAKLLMLARVQLAALRDMAENKPVETWPRSEDTVRHLISELELFTKEFVDLHDTPTDYSALAYVTIGNNLASASGYARILLRDLNDRRRYVRLGTQDNSLNARILLTSGGKP